MSAETEEQAPEQSFLSHLVELRQRIVRAAIAIIIVFIPMAFFMQQIFDFLSQPMLAALPAGTKLLATGVITPFMVPLKVTLVRRVSGRAAVRAVAGMGVRCAGALPAREASGGAADRIERADVFRRHGVLLLRRLRLRLQVHCRLRAGVSSGRARYRGVLRLCDEPVHRFRPDVRSADRRRAAGATSASRASTS